MKEFLKRFNNNHNNFCQSIRFVVSGVLNTSVDLLVLNILLLTFGFYGIASYSFFKAISFAVAVLNSYFLNKYWVFASNGKVSFGETGLFFLVSFVGFLINISVATLTVILLGSVIFNFAVANLGAIFGALFAAIFNFLAYKFIVFKNN